MLEQPVRDNDAAGRDVDLEHRVFGRRDQVLDRPHVADPDVIRRALEDFLDDPQALAGAGHDGQADHLAVVEPSRFERPHLLIRHLEVASADELGHRAVVDAAQLDHEARLSFAAPFDLLLGAVQKQACSRIESVLEVCQGHYLDSTLQPIRTGDLPHPDHAVTSPPERRPRGEGC